jgi:transcriptional regulator with XRE-family HTH domain
MPRSWRQIIGANIRAARERAGMTQEQLAHAIGVEAATLSRYETARWPPRLESLEKIAACLKVPVNDLVVEVRAETEAVRDDERDLLSTYRSMRPKFRNIALRLVRELRKIE